MSCVSYNKINTVTDLLPERKQHTFFDKMFQLEPMRFMHHMRTFFLFVFSKSFYVVLYMNQYADLRNVSILQRTIEQLKNFIHTVKMVLDREFFAVRQITNKEHLFLTEQF